MDLFDRFAERASRFVSRAGFFAFCVLLVVVWGPSLPLFRTVDTWQLIINTLTTIITFLLVALLQNSQWRGDRASHDKLNAIADGLADTMESLAGLMEKLDVHGNKERLIRDAADLRETVGLEQRISASDKDDRTHERLHANGKGGAG